MDHQEARLCFKVLRYAEYDAFKSRGLFAGSSDDLKDGFIHLSLRHQVRGTVEKHFQGLDDLWLLAIAVPTSDTELRMEPSRGGDLFPHLYRALSADDVLWVSPLWVIGGVAVFPELGASVPEGAEIWPKPEGRGGFV